MWNNIVTFAWMRWDKNELCMCVIHYVLKWLYVHMLYVTLFVLLSVKVTFCTRGAAIMPAQYKKPALIWIISVLAFTKNRHWYSLYQCWFLFVSRHWYLLSVPSQKPALIVHNYQCRVISTGSKTVTDDVFKLALITIFVVVTSSIIGKSNCSKWVTPHTTGNRSFARVAHECRACLLTISVEKSMPWHITMVLSFYFLNA